MTDESETDYQRAQRELLVVANELRKKKGEQPLYESLTGEPPYCSFCGKGKNEYKTLVQGPDVYICDECVRKAQKIIDEENV